MHGSFSQSRRRAIPILCSARVNVLIQEVIADQIERIGDADERLGLVTVTGVSCEPDLRHAVVLVSSLPDEGSSRHSRTIARPYKQCAWALNFDLKRACPC